MISSRSFSYYLNISGPQIRVKWHSSAKVESLIEESWLQSGSWGRVAHPWRAHLLTSIDAHPFGEDVIMYLFTPKG